MKTWMVIALMVVWVVGGNALIGLWMSRLHRAVREDLAAARTSFEERAVPARMSSWAFFGGGISWTTGDLLVTDRAVVLFQRNWVIAQPPVLFFRSAADESVTARFMVSRFRMIGAPRIEKGRVIIEGEGRWGVRTKLVLSSGRSEELRHALELFLGSVEPRGTYRDARA